MAGYVCTIAGGKGGVGKTTTVINAGTAFQERGCDVAVIDADLGMANLGSMLGVEPDATLHDVLAGEASVSEALVDTQDGLTVVPGDPSLEAFADADPAKLRSVVETLRNAYDVVFIDTGAGLSHEVAVPLGLADGLVLVTTPNDVAVGDTAKTAELADRVDGTVVGAVVNRVTRQTDLERVADRFEFPLLAVVPDDPQATSDEPLVLTAPESAAADAYRRLSAGLEGAFFRDQTAEMDEAALDEDWFHDDAETEDENEEETGSGVFGLFN